MEYDYLIVGSGMFWSTYANLIKRNHIGCNVYIENIDGISVHKYGADIFHIDYKDVWEYVNSFVEFNKYTIFPIARYNDEINNIPFNINIFFKIWNDVIKLAFGKYKKYKLYREIL